jgi:hypothetical protein
MTITKITTHDNRYFGEVVNLTPIHLGAKAQKKNGVFGKSYVAYAAELDNTNSPSGFSTLVAETEEALVSRYSVA